MQHWDCLQLSIRNPLPQPLLSLNCLIGRNRIPLYLGAKLKVAPERGWAGARWSGSPDTLVMGSKGLLCAPALC